MTSCATLSPCNAGFISNSSAKERSSASTLYAERRRAAVMASKAKEYRQKADEAEQQAASVTDEAAKAIYRNIASHWRQMAEQAERNGW